MNFILSNGVSIPAIGFGTYEVQNKKGIRVLQDAITAGYRHFDTAAFYENEVEVGKAIDLSRVERSEFFITSKVWPSELGYKKTLKSFMASLERLNMDYLDLF